MRVEQLVTIGIATVFVGFVMVVLGSASPGSDFSAGGVIFIGPIPIIFGSGQNGSLLSLISLVAGVSIVLLLYLSARGRRAVGTES